MILNMVGGGAGLNFSVKAYASESALPSVEKENTIAVITETDITSWIFSATEPETPEEGMVWFHVGASSPVAFNALKNGGITVYPLSAKQYVSGAFVTVTAKSYQNGSWVDWFVYLFNYGKQQYKWQARGWKRSSSVHIAKTPTVKTNSNGSVTISLSGANTSADRYPGGGYELVNDFDLTGITTLELDCDITSTQSKIEGVWLVVIPRSATYFESEAVAVVRSQNAGSQTMQLDVSTCSPGSYDIAVCIYLNAENNGAGTVSVTMKELKAVRG